MATIGRWQEQHEEDGLPSSAARGVTSRQRGTALGYPDRTGAVLQCPHPAGNYTGMSVPVGASAGLSAPDRAGVSECRYERTAQPGTAPSAPAQDCPVPTRTGPRRTVT